MTTSGLRLLRFTQKFGLGAYGPSPMDGNS